MRTITCLLVSLALCGCGKNRSYEGDWTYVDLSGNLAEVTLTTSTVKITTKYRDFTYVQSGTYTSMPEYLSLTLNNYDVQDSKLPPEMETRMRNIGILAIPYKIEWKSDDEFLATPIATPGKPTYPSVTYKRKN